MSRAVKPSPSGRRHGATRLRRALLAGAVAIAANALALWAADLVPLATAKGGLLKLLLRVVAWGEAAAGLHPHSAAPVPAPARLAFHLGVGLAMAAVYGLLLERRLPGPPWAKGLQYALAVWLLNALVVLPATGEGVAGAAHLTPAGLIWFAAAHTLFFVVLALLFASLQRGGGAKAASRGSAGVHG